MVLCSIMNKVFVILSPVAVTVTSYFAHVLSKEFLYIQETEECGFILKIVRDMIRMYNQMHHTDKYSKHR